MMTEGKCSWCGRPVVILLGQIPTYLLHLGLELEALDCSRLCANCHRAEAIFYTLVSGVMYRLNVAARG